MKIPGIIILLFLIASCRYNTSKQKLVDYINDTGNKVTQVIKVGDVQATVKFLPADYRKLKQTTLETDTTGIDNDKFYYFDVKFDKVKGEKPSKEKILYLDFDMQNDFLLVQQGDSIIPAICQKIENAVPGSYQYMLAFEKKTEQDNGDFSLVYKDKIFATGVLAFVYTQNDIRNIPSLKEEERK